MKSKLIWLCLSAFLLSACGWHLRGKAPSHTKNTGAEHAYSTVTLQIDHTSPNIETALNVLVAQNTRSSSASSAPEKNAAQLIIYQEQLERKPLVYSETGVPLRYQYRMNVDYAIKDKQGETAVPRQTVSRWQNYDFEPTQIVATAQEEALIRRELSEEIAQFLLTRATTFHALQPKQK